jgi:hypothetical protein
MSVRQRRQRCSAGHSCLYRWCTCVHASASASGAIFTRARARAVARARGSSYEVRCTRESGGIQGTAPRVGRFGHHAVVGLARSSGRTFARGRINNPHRRFWAVVAAVESPNVGACMGGPANVRGGGAQTRLKQTRVRRRTQVRHPNQPEKPRLTKGGRRCVSETVLA